MLQGNAATSTATWVHGKFYSVSPQDSYLAGHIALTVQREGSQRSREAFEVPRCPGGSLHGHTSGFHFHRNPCSECRPQLFGLGHHVVIWEPGDRRVVWHSAEDAAAGHNG